MSANSEVVVSHVDYKHVLDGSGFGASRELAIDEDPRGKAHLALESLVVEFMREGCRRHCCEVKNAGLRYVRTKCPDT